MRRLDLVRLEPGEGFRLEPITRHSVAETRVLVPLVDELQVKVLPSDDLGCAVVV